MLTIKLANANPDILFLSILPPFPQLYHFPDKMVGDLGNKFDDINIYLRVAWNDFERGVRGTRAGMVAQLNTKSGRARVRRRVQFCHAGAWQTSPRETFQDNTRSYRMGRCAAFCVRTRSNAHMVSTLNKIGIVPYRGDS